MKIAINAGHTLKGKGTGAVGILNESIEVRKIVAELIPMLQRKGHTVIDATIDKASSQAEYLREAVKIANNADVDLFLSIHMNAGGGRGCEAYTWKGEKVKQAVQMCEQLSEEGFRNRGVKDGSGYYVIRKTEAVAILLEVCFVDNRQDAALYKEIGVKRIAQAIADSI